MTTCVWKTTDKKILHYQIGTHVIKISKKRNSTLLDYIAELRDFDLRGNEIPDYIIKMSAAISSYISGISQALKSQEKSISSVVILLTTALLNHILTKSYFKCPNSSHEIYGWSFMIVPGLLLAMLTLLGSSRLSLALTGACRTDIDVPETAPRGKRIRTWKFIGRSIGFALVFANLAFLSWVVVTLLFTDVYTCTKIGPSPKKNADQTGYLRDKEKWDTHSKMIGLFLLAACVLVTFIIHVTIKCRFSEFPEKELKGLRSYGKYEAKAANEEFSKLMKNSAEETGRKMVTDMLTKCSNVQRNIDISSQDGAAEAKEEVIAHGNIEQDIIDREHITKVRGFLAVRYPRLDNPRNETLPYCEPERTPENFHFCYRSESIEELDEEATAHTAL